MDTPRIDVKALRTARGWTQAQLAERVGVTQGAVGHWELGHREPLASSAWRLSKALGVPMEDLFTYAPTSRA